MNFKIIALHPKSNRARTFILNGLSSEEVALYSLHLEHPNLKVLHCEPITDRCECEKRTECAPYKIRNHYKARLCQIRGNLQSMTDSEDGLLTCEEVVQIQRLTARVDRIISLFHTRTLDLKKDGKL